MRARSKLVWVSLCLLCETCGVWSYAQGNNSSLPIGRQARRDMPEVNGWPSFLDAPAANAAVNLDANAPVNQPRSAAMQEGMEPFELAKTVARVGDQDILKGELVADANLMLIKEFARIEELPENQRSEARKALLANREILMGQLLQQAIDRKLMYLEFVRTIPVQDDKKKEEAQQKMRKKGGEYFFLQLSEMAKKVRDAEPEQYQTLMRQDFQLFRISVAMRDSNIESPEDPRLEQVLRENGTSLATQQQAFLERVLGKQAVGGHLNLKPEITHEQMLAYYREHLEESHVPTRAKWEQLTVMFSRCRDKYEAGELIAEMGNQVLYGGAQFWAVAQKRSHGKNAANGGYHDWTELGDLRLSANLNQAVFTLPVGELSDIIEDAEGLHIIRVIEREEAHMIPFTEAQIEIQKNLKNESLNKQYNDYVAKLRERTPIWTAEKGFLPRDGGKSN